MEHLARTLIDETVAADLAVEDLCADFIESEVGRFYFDQSWHAHRPHYEGGLRAWLAQRGEPEQFEAVAGMIDQLADGKLTWSDRWNDDYGGGEPSRAVKHRPKKRSQGHEPRRPSPPQGL